MFIQLSEDMEYRGTKYKKGDTVEVGTALGERLILNGHKKTTQMSKAKKTRAKKAK